MLLCWGPFLHGSGTILVSFWYHFGVILVTFCHHFGTLGGSFGDPGPSEGTPEGAKSKKSRKFRFFVILLVAQRGSFADPFSVISVFLLQVLNLTRKYRSILDKTFSRVGGRGGGAHD